jgi:hypothetical protein
MIGYLQECKLPSRPPKERMAKALLRRRAPLRPSVQHPAHKPPRLDTPETPYDNKTSVPSKHEGDKNANAHLSADMSLVPDRIFASRRSGIPNGCPPPVSTQNTMQPAAKTSTAAVSRPEPRDCNAQMSELDWLANVSLRRRTGKYLATGTVTAMTPWCSMIPETGALVHATLETPPHGCGSSRLG